LEYALDQQLLIKSNLCYNPEFLYAINLPADVKKQYLENYNHLALRLSAVETNDDFNASDPNNFMMSIKQELEMCQALLITPTPHDIEQQLKQMVDHCRRWDRIYNLNARELYPELTEVWDRYAY
jgi:hypothetical protein